MITIVDYGMGNLRSVQKAFERIGIPAKISGHHDEILGADKLVLPGVGHFEQGMKNIQSRGLFEVLNTAVLKTKTPIIGICLGMQLMTEFSEEGNCNGFGWIKGKTRKFLFNDNGLKIPHMGWNTLSILKNNSIFKEISPDSFFYFVHSFYISCDNIDNILALSTYGIDFVSSFENENIFGCQFHPEKSHDNGLQIIKNFAEL